MESSSPHLRSKKPAKSWLLWLFAILLLLVLGLFSAFRILLNIRSAKSIAQADAYLAMAKAASKAEGSQVDGAAADLSTPVPVSQGPKVLELPFVGKLFADTMDKELSLQFDSLRDLFAHLNEASKADLVDFVKLYSFLKLGQPNEAAPTLSTAAAAVHAYLKEKFGSLLASYKADLLAGDWQWPGPPMRLTNEVSRLHSLAKLNGVLLKASLAEGNSAVAAAYYADISLAGSQISRGGMIHGLIGRSHENMLVGALLQPGWTQEQTTAFLQSYRRETKSLAYSHAAFQREIENLQYLMEDVPRARKEIKEFAGPSENSTPSFHNLIGSALESLIPDSTFAGDIAKSRAAVALVQSQLTPTGGFSLNEQLPIFEQSEENSFIDKLIGRGSLVHIDLGVYQRLMLSGVSESENGDMALLTMALEQHKAKAGSYPAELQAVAPLFPGAQLPLSRFSNEPFRYQPTADGFKLWGVGRDGVDNGGNSKDDDMLEKNN